MRIENWSGKSIYVNPCQFQVLLGSWTPIITSSKYATRTLVDNSERPLY